MSKTFWIFSRTIPLALVAVLNTPLEALSANSTRKGEEPTAAEEPGSIYTAWSFTIEVPPDMTVCFSAPVDFALYRFQIDGRTLLTIYTGNHPDFPVAAPSSAPEQAILVAGRKATVIDWTSDDNRKSREMLIDLENYFPNFIHIFYENLSPEEVVRAEALIATLRPLEGASSPWQKSSRSVEVSDRSG